MTPFASRSTNAVARAKTEERSHDADERIGLLLDTSEEETDQ